MSKVRVNYKSDLPPIEITFKVNTVEVDVPSGDFAVRFYVDGSPGTSYMCSHINGEYVNCEKTNTTTLTCYINNHKFGCGRLCCDFINMADNSNYADSIQKTVTPGSLEIILVDGAGDDGITTLGATFGFAPNEIASITTEESNVDGGRNIVTITETNGTSHTFAVKNGKKGEQGEPGRNGVYVNLDSEEEVPDFNVVDSLSDDSTTDALSANQGRALKGMIDNVLYTISECDSDDLEHGTNGQYWILSGGVGATVSSPPATTGGEQWSCLRLEVKEDDIITVAAKGGTYSRAWALTNKSSVIYAVAEESADTTENPATLTADENGYLYVNHKITSSNPFSVTIKRNEMAQDIAELQDNVSTLSDTLEDFSDSFSKTYDKEALVLERYWALSGGVGATVSTSMSSFNAGDWGCFRLEVEKDDVITICTKGGTYPRAWALTNRSRVIYAVAEEHTDTTSSPVTLTVQNDGYLYVNCNSSQFNAFYVKIKTDISLLIETLKEDVENNVYSPHYKNNPLPLWKDSIKVLAIGNSYTQDSTAYMAEFVQNANIPAGKICLYAAIQPGSTLNDWVSNYEGGVTKTITRRAGGITMSRTTGSLQQLVAQDWDVIVLQQYSTQVITYDSINPDLTKMLAYIRRDCPNQKVAFAWHSVWSYKTGYQDAEDNEYRWKMICKTSKAVQHYDGIDIIIPTGTAIQNARNTSLAGEEEMTRDGLHLAFGAGRYIAAATWFQILFAPMFNVSVLGNTTTHEEKYSYETTGVFIPVDNTNRELCQKCAFAATIDMWNISQEDAYADPNEPTTPAPD